MVFRDAGVPLLPSIAPQAQKLQHSRALCGHAHVPAWWHAAADRDREVAGGSSNK